MRCVGGGGWFSENSSVLKLNPPTFSKTTLRCLYNHTEVMLYILDGNLQHTHLPCLFVLERKLSTETTDDEDDDSVPVDHDDATG